VWERAARRIRAGPSGSAGLAYALHFLVPDEDVIHAAEIVAARVGPDRDARRENALFIVATAGSL